MVKNKEFRNYTVQETGGFGAAVAPSIYLKGLWLGQLGFQKSDKVKVQCEQGKLTIYKVEEPPAEEPVKKKVRASVKKIVSQRMNEYRGEYS